MIFRFFILTPSNSGYGQQQIGESFVRYYGLWGSQSAGNDLHVTDGIFDQRFSLAGPAAASTIGAYNSMLDTSMFGWTGSPNSLVNLPTVPDFVIRTNSSFSDRLRMEPLEAL
jgi:hypothetical protein